MGRLWEVVLSEGLEEEWGVLWAEVWGASFGTALVARWDWTWGRLCSAVLLGTPGQRNCSRTPACPQTTTPRSSRSLHRNCREVRLTMSNQTKASITMGSGTADSTGSML